MRIKISFFYTESLKWRGWIGFLVCCRNWHVCKEPGQTLPLVGLGGCFLAVVGKDWRPVRPRPPLRYAPSHLRNRFCDLGFTQATGGPWLSSILFHRLPGQRNASFLFRLEWLYPSCYMLCEALLIFMYYPAIGSFFFLTFVVGTSQHNILHYPLLFSV